MFCEWCGAKDDDRKFKKNRRKAGTYSFLGVILQGAAYFCAYADTGPEYAPTGHMNQ